jgi:hypothetical protein
MDGAKRKGRGAQAYSVVRRASRPEARQSQAQKAPAPRPHRATPPLKPCTIVHFCKPPFLNTLQEKGI